MWLSFVMLLQCWWLMIKTFVHFLFCQSNILLTEFSLMVCKTKQSTVTYYTVSKAIPPPVVRVYTGKFLATFFRISCWASARSSLSYSSFSALGKLNWQQKKKKVFSDQCFVYFLSSAKWGVWQKQTYCFWGIGWFGPDSFPVSPYEHGEENVKDNQVADCCRKKEKKDP